MEKQNKIPKDLHKIAEFEELKLQKAPYKVAKIFLYLFAFFLIILCITSLLYNHKAPLKMNTSFFHITTAIFIILIVLVILMSQPIWPRNDELKKISFHEEGIILQNIKGLSFIEWEYIKEISIKWLENINRWTISFISNDTVSCFSLDNIKASYLYPSEITLTDRLMENVFSSLPIDLLDKDSYNLILICMRRAYNAKWTGDIKPSDIFGKEWKQEKVVKEE